MLLWGALLAELLLAGTATSANIEAETRAWHQARVVQLTAADGWLTLVGLYWLKEGNNRFGSAQDNDLVFPKKMPDHMGVLVNQAKLVKLELVPGISLRKNGLPFDGGVLRPDSDGKPDVLQLGTISFYVIGRGDRLGIRVKDSEAAARRKFQGISMYRAQAAWRIEGRLEPAKTPRTVAVPTVLGTIEQLPSPGSVAFTVHGKEYRLDPVVEPGEQELFFIFGDETNRDETYGAGRFLYAQMPRDGEVILDFNRSINPPCAFSAYATCPLPPRQNRLPLRIEAGEKRYGNH